MLYTLIISPIELVVDWVFNLFINKVSQFGVIGAVCGVSIAINFLALRHRLSLFRGLAFFSLRFRQIFFCSQKSYQKAP